MFQNKRGAAFLTPLSGMFHRCKLLWAKEKEGKEKKEMTESSTKRKKESK
jgi:hypothetical protein